MCLLNRAATADRIARIAIAGSELARGVQDRALQQARAILAARLVSRDECLVGLAQRAQVEAASSRLEVA